MEFLLKVHHLKAYQYLHFPERMLDGKPTVGVTWDDAVLGIECDYFWSEVQNILAVLSSETGT